MPLLREAPDATPDPVREAAPAPQEITAQQLRQMQISEFKAWLRTQTNKHRRPYQEETISDYAETASALDRWMAEEDIDGDFTACDVTVLICSGGSPPGTTTPIRGHVTTSSGTDRSRDAPLPWPRSSSATCWR
jgi:hypothetical protein